MLNLEGAVDLLLYRNLIEPGNKMAVINTLKEFFDAPKSEDPNKFHCPLCGFVDTADAPVASVCPDLPDGDTLIEFRKKDRTLVAIKAITFDGRQRGPQPYLQRIDRTALSNSLKCSMCQSSVGV